MKKQMSVKYWKDSLNRQNRAWLTQAEIRERYWKLVETSRQYD